MLEEGIFSVAQAGDLTAAERQKGFSRAEAVYSVLRIDINHRSHLKVEEIALRRETRISTVT